ncbi:KAP family NTPase [Myroides sp. M-43]|uniref:P-loop NTPase fold protein n=1 Tax=Myroides oncorhynchi TaxID=2893756 RepID=UPI001E309D68|nr:P-loop NTPase fold protein [Myroides oncorhynchi]MCC9043712.1 KAP family NTPase [Myroides oncorhynchi]
MTNPTTTIKISNESIIDEFKEHLDLELNQRILFTAPFGAGKSTFINDFEDEHKDGYRFIRLYPVNYAVSANEDIFELIKFDILYELMAHHNEEIALVKEDFDFWLRMSMFMQNKADLMPLFLFVLSQHEKIGKSAAVFIGAVEKILTPLKKGFKEYSEQIKIDVLADITKFLNSFKDKKGSPYEMDATSQFIFDLVDRLKGDELPDQEVIEEDKKITNKTVLVIDDLDRLDPDHIFRLFNIFSAHTHSITGENKFGFDKVVFVCDIENIRKIYAHKYGEGVDFSGYMDKFYSVKPFEFDHKEYLTDQLEEIIKNYRFINTDSEFVNSNEFKRILIGSLKFCLKEKILNLRSLKQIGVMSFDLRQSKNSNYQGMVLPGVIIFTILKEMMGSISVLEQGLLLALKGTEKAYSVLPMGRYSYNYKNGLTPKEYNELINTFMVYEEEFSIDNKQFNFNTEQRNCYVEALDVSVYYSNNSYGYSHKIYIHEVYEGDCIDIIDKSDINKVELSISNLMVRAFSNLKNKEEL